MASTKPEGVHYVQNLFPVDFLSRLDALRESLPSDDGASHLMVANRKYFQDKDLAQELLSYLHRDSRFTSISHIVADMRFIEYNGGGYIAPHRDGVAVDPFTHRASTTSFLLYLSTVGDDQGGTTEFLASLDDGIGGADPLYIISPIRGAIAVFPHTIPHQGTPTGDDGNPKILLRGEAY